MFDPTRRMTRPTIHARRRAWLLVALALAAAALGVSFGRRPGDLAGYLVIGNLALDGRHLYDDAPVGVSTWPPFFSLLCVPLALLARASLVLARGLWIAFNYALLVLVLGLAGRLVYGRAVRWRPRPGELAITSGAVLIPLLLTWRYVASNFEHLQVNIAIFALTLGGLHLIHERREVSGGLALGCAAALKVMPALFIPYLAYRRRWRAAALAAAATALLSVTPVAVYGWSRFVDYVGAWVEAVRRGWSVGKMNLSVYAMWDRIVGHGLVPFAVPGFNELRPSGDPRVTLALALSLAAVTVLALWTFGAGSPDERRARLAEWSIVFLLAALFGTVAWKAYLVVMLLPAMLLYEVWRSPDAAPDLRRGAALTLAASFVLGGLTSDDLIGTSLAWRLEMGSIVTLAALVQLGGLLWLRWRLTRDGVPPGAAAGVPGTGGSGG